jgi:hypothetical protein
MWFHTWIAHALSLGHTASALWGVCAGWARRCRCPYVDALSDVIRACTERTLGCMCRLGEKMPEVLDHQQRNLVFDGDHALLHIQVLACTMWRGA